MSPIVSKGLISILCSLRDAAPFVVRETDDGGRVCVHNTRLSASPPSLPPSS
jgi:hypothetical protein